MNQILLLSAACSLSVVAYVLISGRLAAGRLCAFLAVSGH